MYSDIVHDGYNAFHSSGASECEHVFSQERTDWSTRDRIRANFPLCFNTAAPTEAGLYKLEKNRFLSGCVLNVNGSERPQKSVDVCSFGGVSSLVLQKVHEETRTCL